MLVPVRIAIMFGVALTATWAVAQETDASKTYTARDSLSALDDPSLDAADCLKGFAWQPSSFEVTVETSDDDATPRTVRFASPLDTGNPINDVVTMKWYVAKDPDGATLHRPAVLVAHESGSGMTVGRLVAKTLSLYGVHAFLIHLPHYGDRRDRSIRPENQEIVKVMRQAVVDVRRGRDAIAVLPDVDADHIGLQGTSLGGFVAALAGSLDSGFDKVYITLAGGDFHGLLVNGEKDAAKMRQRLADAGYTGDKLKQLVQQVEPLRIAHRLVPDRTWMFTGSEDRVVPFANAQALAKAAKLSDDHHVIVPANHYTAILYFPTIIDVIVRQSLPADAIPAALKSDS
ncbi:dienelactone hydrolase family protein [Rosistilla oblonga]|uniref:dienelactone hydrolase family protein n=1 Tax=Rosistilla oblonga TaxID=2527990 RepID=UPI003A96ED91